jgi:hypothetical protein
MLTHIERHAIAKASEGKGGERGPALELAVAMNQLLADQTDCTHRFLMLNATEIGEDRRPLREWDVIRLDLLRNGEWAVTAIECAVNRVQKKDDVARDSLGTIQDAIRGPFSDLHSYTTLLATLDDSVLSYEDAGRSYTSA